MGFTVNRKRLKKVRTESKDLYKQNLFAEKVADCSPTYLSYIENGKQSPNAKVLNNILSYRQQQLSPKILNLNYYFNFSGSWLSLDAQEVLEIFRNSETIDDFLLASYGLDEKSTNILRTLVKKSNDKFEKEEDKIVAQRRLSALNNFIQSPAFSHLMEFWSNQQMQNALYNKEVLLLKKELQAEKEKTMQERRKYENFFKR